MLTKYSQNELFLALCFGYFLNLSCIRNILVIGGLTEQLMLNLVGTKLMMIRDMS